MPENVLPGTIILMPQLGGCGAEISEQSPPSIARIFYLDEVARNSLMIQFYLLDKESDRFELVYPSEREAGTGIKIWKINYPENVYPDSIYLEKHFPNPKVYRPLLGALMPR